MVHIINQFGKHLCRKCYLHSIKLVDSFMVFLSLVNGKVRPHTYLVNKNHIILYVFPLIQSHNDKEYIRPTTLIRERKRGLRNEAGVGDSEKGERGFPGRVKCPNVVGHTLS